MSTGDHPIHYDDRYGITDCAKENIALRAENEALKYALRTIAHPIKFLQENADKVGGVLNGSVAMQISNDAGWLRNVALAALEPEKEGK